MLSQVLNATLRILFFRAGPQDFPYGKGLTPLCVGVAMGANAALLSFLFPPLIALFGAAVNVAFLAVFTRVTLNARKLENRFQQTFNSLMLSTALLTLLMLPFFASIAPVLHQIADMLAKDPQLAHKPELLPPLPAKAMLLLSLIGLWQIIVTCRIFLLAAGTAVMLILLGVMLSMMILPSLMS